MRDSNGNSSSSSSNNCCQLTSLETGGPDLVDLHDLLAPVHAHNSSFSGCAGGASSGRHDFAVGAVLPSGTGGGGPVAGAEAPTPGNGARVKRKVMGNRLRCNGHFLLFCLGMSQETNKIFSFANYFAYAN